MKIKCFSLGSYSTNLYIASFGTDAYIIDAPEGIEPALEYVEESRLKVKAILLTHGHFDHILGLGKALEALGDVPVYLAKEDHERVADWAVKLISMLKDFYPYFYASNQEAFDALPSEYLDYESFPGPFVIIKTPGHTKGSVSIKMDDVLFSGDTLFQCGMGRTDLGGDFRELVKSLRTLFTLDPSTYVLPGHGPGTTIGAEKSRGLV